MYSLGSYHRADLFTFVGPTSMERRAIDTPREPTSRPADRTSPPPSERNSHARATAARRNRRRAGAPSGPRLAPASTRMTVGVHGSDQSLWARHRLCYQSTIARQCGCVQDPRGCARSPGGGRGLRAGLPRPGLCARSRARLWGRSCAVRGRASRGSRGCARGRACGGTSGRACRCGGQNRRRRDMTGHMRPRREDRRSRDASEPAYRLDGAQRCVFRSPWP